MTHSIRTLTGCAALAAGLWLISPATADTPQLPAESYKKAAEADIKFLQTRLAELVKEEANGQKVRPGFYKPAVAVALLVSAYGDAMGDAALKADAIKVAEAIEKKKFKDAEGVAKTLAPKPGKAGKPGAMPKPFDDADMLMYIMQPYRGGTVGGLNIERDIDAMTKSKNPMKIEPDAVEVLAVRAAVINSYAFHTPNDPAKVNAANKKLWEKWSMESVDLSKQLVAEAAKGKGFNEANVRTLLNGINARCNDCHEKFRDN